MTNVCVEKTPKHVHYKKIIGVSFVNVNKQQGLEIVRAEFKFSFKEDLFPFVIELKECDCKVTYQSYSDFPEKDHKCSHGNYFVQYTGEKTE